MSAQHQDLVSRVDKEKESIKPMKDQLAKLEQELKQMTQDAQILQREANKLLVEKEGLENHRKQYEKVREEMLIKLAAFEKTIEAVKVDVQVSFDLPLLFAGFLASV